MDYKITIQDLNIEDYRRINGIYVHKSITNDKLSLPIFRYIAYEHLLSLLNQSKLYVSNRSTFTDLTESGNIVNIKYELPMNPFIEDKEEADNMVKLTLNKRNAAYNVCASCWTEDIHTYGNESFLMWKCYAGTKEFCRIETTIETLINSLFIDEDSCDVVIAKMNYVDYKQKKFMGNIQHYLFDKPIAYTGEQEIRLYVLTSNQHAILNINPFNLIKGILITPFIDKKQAKVIIEYLRNINPHWDIVMSFNACVALLIALL